MKSTFQIFCVAAGSLVSAGIFILPGRAFGLAGPAMVVAYLAAGLAAGLGLLALLEMATALPRAKGDYFFITRALGPACGTVAGIVGWAACCLKVAFAVIGIGILCSGWFTTSPRAVALAAAAFFTVLNMAGIRKRGVTEVGLVTLMLVIMALYVAAGFTGIQAERFYPFMPQGLRSVAGTAALVFVAFGGLEITLALAGEVRGPVRSLPRALAGALAGVVVLYVLIMVVTIGLVPGPELGTALTPVSEAAEKLLGRPGRRVLELAALIAFATTAHYGIMGAGRCLYGQARDRLLPTALGRLQPYFCTPQRAFLASGALVMGAVYVLNLGLLIQSASALFIFANILAMAAVITFRQSRMPYYQPTFRMPGYPWVPLLALAGFLGMLVLLPGKALLLCLGVVSAALAFYQGFGKRYAHSLSGFGYLVERRLNRLGPDFKPEEELKPVARQRDGLDYDDFDQVLEDCPVWDLSDTIKVGEFFEQVTRALAPKLSLPPDELYQRFEARERESSTVLSPYLAIPHVLAEGTGVFHIIVARCRAGVVFESEGGPRVKAVFALVSSRDQRALFLRALAALSQIVQQRDFACLWQQAADTEALRELLLLAERRRRPIS